MPHPWELYHTPEAFLADESFRRWVRSGQFRDPAHPASRWLAAHPDRREAVTQATQWLLASVLDESEPTDAEVETLRQGVWQRIGESTETVPLGRPTRSTRWWGWAAAAVVTLALGWWGIGYWNNQPGTQTAQRVPPVPIQEVRNESGRSSLVSLPDGSTVWLETGSRLRYPERFTGPHRDVELTGEAFFEISKDARHPFQVRTPNLLTSVLGTSFTVRAKPGDPDVRVQVRTGRVAVYPIRQERVAAQPVAVLRAHQQLVLRRAGQDVVRSAVDHPLALATRLDQHSFDFSDAPVARIFRAIEQAYGVRIVYDPTAYQNCSLTTSLSDEPLTEKLRIVTATMGEDVRFALENGRIRVWGPGCP